MLVTFSPIVMEERPLHPIAKNAGIVVTLFPNVISLIDVFFSKNEPVQLLALKCTVIKLSQPENALLPMLVTPSPIVNSLRLLQSLNVPSPIVVTPSGIVIDVRLLQPSNAEEPMLVTLSPIITEERPLHPLAKSSGIVVTLFPNVISLIDVFPMNGDEPV